MGDVDIVVHKNDLGKVDQIMLSLNYDKMIDNHAGWTYWTYQFMFEIHNHMFYEDLSNDIDYVEYFDQVWQHKKHGKVFGIESDNMYIPDEDFHFLYLMTHTAKHILNNGSGFRPFLDMIFMTRECRLNWDLIIPELKKLELYEFTKTCFALCEEWFDVEMPFDKELIDPDFLEKTTSKMFEDGLFGLDNEENIVGSTAKNVERSHHSYVLTSLELTRKRLFPPYRDMQLIGHYKFVDGRPYLLPAAWIYRWIYCLINKPANGFRLLMEPVSKRKEIKKRQHYINDWGL